MKKITITTPDDWHLHFRDSELLRETVPATARSFARAIVMPNLVPPVTNAELAQSYRQRILEARPEGSSFTPLMTLYLTNETTPEDLRSAKNVGVTAVKLYPSGATTNSEGGVGQIEALQPIFAEMEKLELPLLVHGEVTDSEIDIFDREKVFIDRHLQTITNKFSNLRVVFEHITTKDAVDFVKAGSKNLAATVTPQHLMMNRNDLLVGGIRPHNFCLPVLKRRTHQEALREAATSGSEKFFLGTDSAPHDRLSKESACGCAGCYSAPAALELYAHVFDELGALDKLEGFASHHGADFYGLPRNVTSVTLENESWSVPETVELSDGTTLIPFYAGQSLSWRQTR